MSATRYEGLETWAGLASDDLFATSDTSDAGKFHGLPVAELILGIEAEASMEANALVSAHAALTETHGISSFGATLVAAADQAAALSVLGDPGGVFSEDGNGNATLTVDHASADHTLIHGHLQNPGPGSQLLDLQTDAVSKFTVTQEGYIRVPGVTNDMDQHRIGHIHVASTGNGPALYGGTGQALTLLRSSNQNGAQIYMYALGGVETVQAARARLGISGPAQGSYVFLEAETNHILLQKNGAHPQEQRWFNDGTSGAEEWGFVGWTGDTFRIGTDKSGTGSGRSIEIIPSVGGNLYFGSGGGANWSIVSSNFGPQGTDNLRDLGGAANRIRRLHLGTAVSQQTSSTADPSTADYPSDKDWGIHENTTSGSVFLAFNNGGTIVKTQLT